MARMPKLKPSEDLPPMARQFRNWRRALGLTRRKAAQKLGITEHTLQSYELGRRRSGAAEALAKQLWAQVSSKKG